MRPKSTPPSFDRNSRWQVRMENAHYKAHKQLMQLTKERDAARAKAAAQAAKAAAQAEAEDDADAEPAVDCLYWLNKETGELTQVAGPPQPYDPTRDPASKEYKGRVKPASSPKPRRPPE